MAVVMAVALTLAAVPMPEPDPALGDCPEIIQAYFGERSRQACNVAFCESTWNPNAISRGGHVGYFQIASSWGWHASVDPDTNVSFAYELSRGGTDWSNWSCRP